MVGTQEHICSSQCMFCRVLDSNPQRVKITGQRSVLDNQVLDRVKELEQRSLLSNTEKAVSDSKSDSLERLALVDALTELYNSRTFTKELTDEIRRAKRYKRPVSLLTVQIDGFKEIVRQYGALTGDTVLKVTAAAIHRFVREIDIAARYNAEEFAIILPETNATGAAAVAERIRQQIAAQVIKDSWPNIKVTASIGIASFPLHAREQEELLTKAQEALNEAAHLGGDRAVAL